jgi:hypothetical protein
MSRENVSRVTPRQEGVSSFSQSVTANCGTFVMISAMVRVSRRRNVFAFRRRGSAELVLRNPLERFAECPRAVAVSGVVAAGDSGASLPHVVALQAVGDEGDEGEGDD